MNELNTAWEFWNVASSLWALATAAGAGALWFVSRTAAYEDWKLRRETAAIFYRYRALFVQTELNYSIPAFVRSDDGMTQREWSYHAITRPSPMYNRDWMEYITIINRARQSIKTTLKAPDIERRMEAYQQLAPRFNQLCQELNLMRDTNPKCPVQFHQTYLELPVVTSSGTR